MKKKFYKKYTRDEMMDIIENKGYYYIETSNGGEFQIAKDDLADFIILEDRRCGHGIEIEVYIPGDFLNPILTTYGCYLNRVNPKLREEIIDRLVKLQTYEEEPKTVKIFNIDIYNEMFEEGLEEDNPQCDKPFFAKYYEEEEEAEL